MRKLDNHDSRIRYVHLTMERADLDGIAHFDLPEGYRFVLYQPGDCEHWMEIERSAKELPTREAGLAAWERYYGGLEDTLRDRMLFIENAKGEKVATATAYAAGDWGQVHWVAIRRDEQGRGLARPLIARVLELLKQLGHDRAFLTTQTTTWVACRLYLQFGFVPAQARLEQEREGWRILHALVEHPALSAFEPLEDIWAE